MNTHDDGTDPTGMRALLRGLPDPGPMPDDLVQRIQASLGELADGHERVGRGPVPVQPTVGGVPRGTHDPRRSSWWVRNAPRLAVAAVVVVGGGALVSGPLGLLGHGEDSMTATSDAAGGAVAERGAGTPGVAPQSDDDTEAAQTWTTPGPVVVHMSGRSYTAAGLATQVGDLSSAAPTRPFTAESPGIGPIGTEIGVRSCLEALGLPRDTATDVDLGQVDGTPAAVLVVTAGGKRTAYAVGRECTLGNPAVLAGPVTLS